MLILASRVRIVTAKGSGYRRASGEPFPEEITKMRVITNPEDAERGVIQPSL
jgi:hypothetical protein